MLAALENIVLATKTYLTEHGLTVEGTQLDSSPTKETVTLRTQLGGGISCEILLTAMKTRALLGARVNGMHVALRVDNNTTLALTFEAGSKGLLDYARELPCAMHEVSTKVRNGKHNKVCLALLQAKLKEHFGDKLPTELLEVEETYTVTDKYAYTTPNTFLDVVRGTLGPGGFRITCEGNTYNLLHYGDGKFSRATAEKLLALTEEVTRTTPEALMRQRAGILVMPPATGQLETSLELA